ncbi:DNA methyltransferase 1-associated protein 1 [Neocloeon triangulifer]|uniref:DNA methyltransferase 1-associated protein 1 n=1 Tax=Neocloeon triangulifer TaxID=2078957 RepID=UPI00286ECE6C|nr:DNA methyltransferase 1-associated protein 1 [Neocloeon triangulifer]
MADIRDILDINEAPGPQEGVTKESILGHNEKSKKKQKPLREVVKRPEGMHRELYALLYTDNKDAPPLIPSDTVGTGYKQLKAKLGMRRVRPWKWMPFTNPARTDGAVFHHWRRAADEGKEYPFAQFNKKVPIPTYTDAEYQQHLTSDGWTKEETDLLFDLGQRFDLRFVVIHDRWDKEKFPNRTIEDMKSRYYEVCGTLTKAKSTATHEPKVFSFDAEHEKRRKEQLKRLFERKPEEIEEEQMLLAELKKIEVRKKEREKKTQDLQKLITAADNQAEARKLDKKAQKKKVPQQQARPKPEAVPTLEFTGIKFPDFKNSGVTLRSHRMKLPSNVGQKKSKAIEQMLQELGIEMNPMPTLEICTHFNELRSDMVLLHELRTALSSCVYELQTLRHQYEALCPGKTLQHPPLPSHATSILTSLTPQAMQSPTKTEKGEIIDVVGSPGTPMVTTPAT